MSAGYFPAADHAVGARPSAHSSQAVWSCWSALGSSLAPVRGLTAGTLLAGFQSPTLTRAMFFANLTDSRRSGLPFRACIFFLFFFLLKARPQASSLPVLKGTMSTPLRKATLQANRKCQRYLQFVRDTHMKEPPAFAGVLSRLVSNHCSETNPELVLPTSPESGVR